MATKSEKNDKGKVEAAIEAAAPTDAPAEVAPPASDALDMPAIKARWIEQRDRIEARRAELSNLEAMHETDSAFIAAAVLEAAKSKGAEPVIQLGRYRMKVRMRPAKRGGGAALVDASISEPIEV